MIFAATIIIFSAVHTNPAITHDEWMQFIAAFEGLTRVTWVGTYRKIVCSSAILLDFSNAIPAEGALATFFGARHGPFAN